MVPAWRGQLHGTLHRYPDAQHRPYAAGCRSPRPSPQRHGRAQQAWLQCRQRSKRAGAAPPCKAERGQPTARSISPGPAAFGLLDSPYAASRSAGYRRPGSETAATRGRSAVLRRAFGVFNSGEDVLGWRLQHERCACASILCGTWACAATGHSAAPTHSRIGHRVMLMTIAQC